MHKYTDTVWTTFMVLFMFELDSSSPRLLSLYGKGLSQDIVLYFIFHGRQNVIEFLERHEGEEMMTDVRFG